MRERETLRLESDSGLVRFTRYWNQATVNTGNFMAILNCGGDEVQFCIRAFSL